MNNQLIKIIKEAKELFLKNENPVSLFYIGLEESIKKEVSQEEIIDEIISGNKIAGYVEFTDKEFEHFEKCFQLARKLKNEKH